MTTNAPANAGGGEKHGDALAMLRAQMKAHSVYIYLILEQDEHLSEYVADCDRRVRYVSNFTGSAATLTIGMHFAELATDSRYYVIAERELSPEWELRKLGKEGVLGWQDAVAMRAKQLQVRVGVDPKLIGAEVARDLNTRLNRVGSALVPIHTNLVDLVWSERPPLPPTMAFEHALKYAGESRESKLARLRAEMAALNAKSFVIFQLEEIAWLLNLRAGDIPYLPVIKAFALVTSEAVVLYADKQKLGNVLPALETISGFQLLPYTSFFATLHKRAVEPVWVPSGGGSWAIELALVGKQVIHRFSIVNLMRAIKNHAEVRGIRNSQLKCSVSICRYLSWLEQEIVINNKQLTEYEGAQQLLRFRQHLDGFQMNSFETISSTGPNASAPHYAPSKHSSSLISGQQIYLLDSGSQFCEGTTDITRTVHFTTPKQEEVLAYTLVLKGHIAVASAVFPINTNGARLDILARQSLWEHGMDYGHGTGHGIGSFLNVHELPLGIGTAAGPECNLQPGHFLSDEPGFYKDNEFGVRIESDLLVIEKFVNPNGRKFLGFEMCTVVPFEPRLIDTSLLTKAEIEFINGYHQRCRELLSPLLHLDTERAWLDRCTAPLVQ